MATPRTSRSPDASVDVVQSERVSQHLDDPDVVRRLQERQWAGWANPFSGRRLPQLLHRAGLQVDPDIGSQALILSQEVAASAPMGQQSTAAAVADGAISEDERAGLLDDLAAAGQQGWAVVSVTMFAVLARRPG